MAKIHQLHEPRKQALIALCTLANSTDALRTMLKENPEAVICLRDMIVNELDVLALLLVSVDTIHIARTGEPCAR